LAAQEGRELSINPAVAALQALQVDLPVGIAFSGGADSTALLHAAAATWPGQVRALHVHHGLQAAADAFARHCRAVCEDLGLPLEQLRVDARHRGGESPEDAARRARYAALAAAARRLGLQHVLLAQHADDQVETLLLALSRGAGLPGLSGMPVRFEREGVAFERPLLALPGPALRQWLTGQGLPWMEDPTNTDTRRTRNRIRHLLLPALAEAFPQFRQTFARSARHAAQAQPLLAALAQQDLNVMGGEPSIGPLRALERDRQANVLRHWLRSLGAMAPSAAQLEELLDQVADCTTRGHRIRIKVSDGLVERVKEQLRFSRPI